MGFTRSVISVLLSLLGLQADPGPETREPPAPRSRVIVRVNRDLEVAGHVELEDADILVIRSLGGRVESYSKHRLAKIIRLVEPAPGQTGTVYLRDGQVRRGTVIEDGFDEVVLEIEGIRTRLNRSAVEEVVLEPTFEERYAQIKASLRPGMADAHLELCRWLFAQRRYELARDELRALVADAPTPEAGRLLELVEAQLALTRGAAPRAAPEAPDRPDGGWREPPVIGRDDVNLIRVYEIDFERPPRVAVGAETIRTLIERYGHSSLIPATQEGRTALYRADPVQIVRLMLDLAARDLYPQIEVVTEPYSLSLFRRRVHDAWLIPNCATSRCHGGPDAGRFFLHRRNHKDERVRYTNLLILERLELDPQWPLVNYVDPEASLIVQGGMPRDTARKPHPEVPGWKPLFGRGQQRMVRQTVDWIESMAQPRPAYPVDYRPPAPGGRWDAGPVPSPGPPPPEVPPAGDPPGDGP